MDSINQSLFLALNADANASLFTVKIAALLAEWPVGVAALFAIVVVVRQDNGKKHLIRQLFLAVSVAMIATYFIRESLHYPRPFVLGLGKTWVSHDATPSFPSFHATFLFSLGFALLRTGVNTVAALFIVVLGCLTAWSRVYLGIHFPLDMVGAFFVALSSLFIVLWLPKQKLSEGS